MEKALTFPDGKTVKYRAHEHLYYVTNVEDSTYQYLNFYVPESAQEANSSVPIFFAPTPADVWLPKRETAEAPDDVFAVVSYCPIPDPEHADSAYEGWYGCTNTKERALS